MSVSREMILVRIHSANSSTGPRADPGAEPGGDPPGAGGGAGAATVDVGYAALPRLYRLAHHQPPDGDADPGTVALFAERAADYRATVERVQSRFESAASSSTASAGEATSRWPSPRVTSASTRTSCSPSASSRPR